MIGVMPNWKPFGDGRNKKCLGCTMNFDLSRDDNIRSGADCMAKASAHWGNLRIVSFTIKPNSKDGGILCNGCESCLSTDRNSNYKTYFI